MLSAWDHIGGDENVTATKSKTAGRLVDIEPVLRRMMTDHKLTPAALARELDVPKMTVWHWLHGVRATLPFARLVAQGEVRLQRRNARQATSDAA